MVSLREYELSNEWSLFLLYFLTIFDSNSLWLLGSLECLLRHWQCVSQCFLADWHSTLDGWYFFNIIICLLFYQFTNFNTLLDEKIRRIKTIFPVTSIISRDPSWHDMENCSVIIQGATSLYFVSFSTKYNLLSSWRGLKNVRLFRETSTMKAVLNSGRE